MVVAFEERLLLLHAFAGFGRSRESKQQIHLSHLEKPRRLPQACQRSPHGTNRTPNKCYQIMRALVFNILLACKFNRDFIDDMFFVFTSYQWLNHPFHLLKTQAPFQKDNSGVAFVNIRGSPK